MDEINIGTLMLNRVSDLLLEIYSDLRDCRPSPDYGTDENARFLDSCIQNGSEIVRLAKMQRDAHIGGMK